MVPGRDKAGPLQETATRPHNGRVPLTCHIEKFGPRESSTIVKIKPDAGAIDRSERAPKSANASSSTAMGAEGRRLVALRLRCGRLSDPERLILTPPKGHFAGTSPAVPEAHYRLEQAFSRSTAACWIDASELAFRFDDESTSITPRAY